MTSFATSLPHIFSTSVASILLDPFLSTNNRTQSGPSQVIGHEVITVKMRGPTSATALFLSAAAVYCTVDHILAFAPSSTAHISGKTHPARHVLRSTSSSSSESSSDDATTSNNNKEKKRIVIVGGGWAGFSAADALSTHPDPTELEIILLDASPRGRGGLAGSWTTQGNRPVEAGIHGFWREYRNTFAAMERIGLDLDEVLGPYSPSVLVSKSGRVALAPVLGSKDDDEKKEKQAPRLPSPLQVLQSPQSILEPIAELLPPPLDVALLSEFNPKSPLNVFDRISAIGLLGAWADFGQEDPASWDIYDKVSAEELFLESAGVTKRLYDELVSPLLHVLPMTPGYDCSAAAALSCFHVFALQSRGAFDVRWCRGGISEQIFDPWAQKLLDNGNVEIKGSSRVSSITTQNDNEEEDDQDGSAKRFKVEVIDGETISCDGVILAVGGTSMGKIIDASKETDALMGPQNFDKVRGVTCVAVRLFLEPDAVTSGLSGGQHESTQLPKDVAKAMKDTPVIVCGAEIGSLPDLKETGFCIYDLQRMQDPFAVRNGSGDDVAVIEVDFFRADSIADMTDDEVAALTLKAVAKALNTKEIEASKIVDSSVVRARNAVSHFAVNSASCSPDVKIRKGIYMCGDWIDRRGHASWSTEKSVVTGRQAVAALANDLDLNCDTKIIPAAPDTAQLKTLRTAASQLRATVPPPGSGIPPSPWSFAKELLQR